jgi:aminoglycoside N3'-acetyltransferase
VRAASDITADLRALGVRSGDCLMVHASLRRIGPVRGGAAAVVAAIDAALGPEGTWMMVYGAADDHAWVNQRPEDERAALLAGATPFDHLRTPVLGEVGVLAEVMRTAPGTVVNNHPEGRFGARGRLAGQWLADTPWDDYYGPGSPLERFVMAGGRVLRMGADPDTVTVLHHAEYLADVADKLRVRRHRLVASAEGPRIVVVECLDDEDGIVPAERQPAEDYFAIILREYLADHPHRAGLVGEAESQLFDAGEIVRFGAAWMGAHLR